MDFGGFGGFMGPGLNFNHQGAQMGMQIGESMMGDIEAMAALQMKMQTEMGLLNMMIKLNEALAKMFKAIGDAVKGLVG